MTSGPGPVLIVTPWYLESLGGVAVVAERLRKGLSQAGVPVQLMVALGDPQSQDAGRTPGVWRYGVPATYFGTGTLRSLAGTIARAPTTLWRLFRFLRAHRIRNVILIYPIAYSWPFLLLRRPMGVSLMTSLHGNDVERFETHSASLQWLQRKVLRASDVIVACGPHLIETAQGIVGPHARATAVIPNGVDVTHFTLPPPEHRRRIPSPHLLHISNFVAKKRTDEIVEAFAQADLPSEARLTMAGDGPCRDAAMRRARDLGIDGRIDFPGRVSDVRKLLWDAEALILASDSEGAPLVLVEAMACGVPFISTPWGAARDLPSGECGLTVAVGDLQGLANAMETVIRDPETREGMASRARVVAVERYSLDAYIERHLELLR